MNLLLLVAALQQAPPTVGAAVDRQDLAVGELLTLTIRVEARGNEPLEIGEPVLSGLERRGFREQSQISIQGGIATRVTTRQIQLLAGRAGVGTVGPIRVRQGSVTVETQLISVQVTQRGGAITGSLSPRARAMVEGMPPPEGIESVALGVVASPRTAMVGTQVDVIVAAWFPRETRLQLRTPPTVSGPSFQGAWVYPQLGPSGIATSRQVNGRWYDIFLTHDVVFPLTVGRLEIGRARVSYGLPVTYSFLTRELRHEAHSEPLAVAVMAQPDAGRPAAASGMAAGGLRLAVSAAPRALALGEASAVSVTLSGRGNVALWPEPAVSWPDEARVYPGDGEQTVRLENGLVVGTKEFRYLLVPDSAGIHTIRGVRIVYYDLDTRRYASLQAAPVDVVAGETATVAAARQAGLPLLAARRPGLGARPIPPAWVVVALLLGPAGAALVRAAPRLTTFLRRRPHPEPESLETAHRRFRTLLERLVPAAALREGDQLHDALRAAGVEPTVAAHATRVRDRLRHAVYGLGGATDAAELTLETNAVVTALAGDPADRQSGGTTVALLVAGLLLGAAPAAGSAQTAERLFEAGAFRAAADSFADRARRDSLVAAHWFNLGEASYRAGDEVAARAAWIRAARLGPRNGAVTRALGLLPAPDGVTAALTPVAPLTPTEAWLVALALWTTAWILVARRRRWRLVLVPLILGLGVGAWAWRLEQQYRRPVALVRRANTPLRAAPYGSAPSRRGVNDGAGVEVQRASGPWLLVKRGAETGWLLASDVVRI